MIKDYNIDIKIFLFGESLVGKTTLIKNFYDSSNFKIQDYYYLKQFQISREIILDLKFFDYHEDGIFDIDSYKTLINKSTFLFLLFNLNDANSFDNLIFWFEEIIKKCDLRNKMIILIGNEKYNFEREINFYKGNNLITEFGGFYFEINILNEKWKIKQIIYSIIILNINNNLNILKNRKNIIINYLKKYSFFDYLIDEYIFKIKRYYKSDIFKRIKVINEFKIINNNKNKLNNLIKQYNIDQILLFKYFTEINNENICLDINKDNRAFLHFLIEIYLLNAKDNKLDLYENIIKQINEFNLHKDDYLFLFKLIFIYTNFKKDLIDYEFLIRLFKLLKIFFNKENNNKIDYFLFYSEFSEISFDIDNTDNINDIISFYFNFDNDNNNYNNKIIKILKLTFDKKKIIIKNNNKNEFNCYLSLNHFTILTPIQKTKNIKLIIIFDFTKKKIIYIEIINEQIKEKEINFSFIEINKNNLKQIKILKSFKNKLYSFYIYNEKIEPNFFIESDDNQKKFQFLMKLIPVYLTNNFLDENEYKIYDYLGNFLCNLKYIKIIQNYNLKDITEIGGFKIFLPLLEFLNINKNFLIKNEFEFFNFIIEIILSYFNLSIDNNFNSLINDKFFDIFYLYVKKFCIDNNNEKNINNNNNFIDKKKFINYLINAFESIEKKNKKIFIEKILSTFYYSNIKNIFNDYIEDLENIIIIYYLFDFDNIKYYYYLLNLFFTKNDNYIDIINDFKYNQKVFYYKNLYKNVYETYYLSCKYLIDDNNYIIDQYKIKNYVTNIFNKPIIYPIFNYKYYFNIYNNNNNNNNNNFNDYILYSFGYIKNNSEKILKENNIINYYCTLIKLNRIIKGFIFIDFNNDIIFLSNNFDKIIKINIFEIKYIFKKIYFYLENSIDIFLINGKNYFFNFDNIFEYEQFMKNILTIYDFNHIINDIKNNYYFYNNNILAYFNPLNIYGKIFYSINQENNILLSDIILNWRNYVYSNYFIIILFNLFSNRSFLNINQYPIFPSLLLSIQNLENEKLVINRDLSKSINFYKSKNKNNNKFFDNISNKKIIIDLLKNIPPFNITKKVENYNTNNNDDDNDNNINILDILELSPENYSIPLNSIDSLYLNDFYLLEHFTKLLESDKTSEQLHIWLNYIFGIYQKGKKSKYYLNVYSNESYLDNKENNKKYHYSLNKENIYKGFVPIQIIDNKEICERIKKNKIENLFYIKHKKEVKNINKNEFDLKNNNLYYIKCNNEKNYILLGKDVLLFKLSKKYFFNNFSSQKFKTNLNYCFCKKNNNKLNHIAIDNNNNYIFIGGSNNHILFINLEKIKNNNKSYNESNFNNNNDINNLTNDNNNYYYNIKISYNSQKSNLITSLIMIENFNKYLISGDIYGTIVIFQININNVNNILEIKNILFSLHSYEITSLNYNPDLNLLASSSSDGQINIFTFPKGKVIFSMKFSFPIDNIFLFYFSIPSFIIYSKQKEKIFSYSLNGVLLKELNEKKFINPICYYCNNNSSNIIYINNINSIKILNVPFFNNEKTKEITFDFNIISFDISNINNIFFILSENGEKIIKIFK